MALDLYLAVVDGDGSVIPGQSTVDRLVNPFRGKAVIKPFVVTSYSFAADSPFVSASGGGGKVAMSELTVVMPDDAAAGVLFHAIATGRHLQSVDVLAVKPGDKPVVVAGVGIASPAVVAGLAWSVTTDAVQRTLKIDGTVFSAGSAVQRPDGSYGAFAFTSFNTATNT